ncbi:zinc ribbon domain-containing protein YjdM [Methylocella tundrae]|nr:zinc ribbon domain-containing protein YjdM [Methylocella tundrae]
MIYGAGVRAARRRQERNDVTDEIIVKDSNGTRLADGDDVTLIKDLKVKGTSETLKRGTLVRNIRLTDAPGEIECSTKQVKGLVLKTEFLKKA